MNRIDTSQIVDPGTQQPFTGPSLNFLQNATKSAISEICQSLIGDTYSTSVPYAIWGLQYGGTQSAPTAVNIGYIFFNGELYFCGGNGTITTNALFTITTTFDPMDPVLFSDNSPHSVHQVRTIVVTDSAASPVFPQFDLSSVVYVYDVLNAATLQNGYTDATYVPVGFTRDLGTGRVHLKGVAEIASLASGTVIFTLPVGYRPSVQRKVICTVYTNGLNGGSLNSTITVDTNGDVKQVGITAGSNSGVVFDGLWFML